MTFQPITHVIFDVDGLLLDTERLYTQATQLIADDYGKVYSWEVKVGCMGMKAPSAARHIIDSLGLPLSVEQFCEKMGTLSSAIFPNAQLLPGAEKLVRHLHRHSIPMAIASGGGQDGFQIKITNHCEFFKLFNHAVMASSDPEVKKGKPAPDVFLICANRFPDKPCPEKCLVFEDAPNGVAAAVAAKMQVVMVPDARLSRDVTAGTTQVLSSLEEFKPEMFGLPAYD